MGEEERRRCCALGGCGCSGGSQLRALAEIIEAAGGCEAAAQAMLDLFGEGPHHERLATLKLQPFGGKGDGENGETPITSAGNL
jgi:hypothetical protein